MSFVTLAGPKTQIDYLVNNYLSKHDIHLENALTEFSSTEQFTTFTEENPFKSSLNKSHELMQLVHAPEKAKIQKLTVADAEKFLDKIDEELVDVRDEIAKLKEQIEEKVANTKARNKKIYRETALKKYQQTYDKYMQYIEE